MTNSESGNSSKASASVESMTRSDPMSNPSENATYFEARRARIALRLRASCVPGAALMNPFHPQGATLSEV